MKNRVFLFLICAFFGFTFPVYCEDIAYIKIVSYINQNPTDGFGSYIKFENTELLKDIEISKEKNTIKFNKPGLYYLNLTLQCGSNDFGATGFIDCWFEKNGKPLLGSTTRISVDSQDSVQVLTTSGIELIEIDDEIAIKFSASGPGIGITTYTQKLRPSVSSAEFIAYQIN